MRARGFTLVSTLATIAIIAMLMVAMMYGMKAFGGAKPGTERKDGLGTTVMGATMADARDTACKSNLDQLRQMIQLSQTTDDQAPQSLDEIRGAASIDKCPIDHKPYIYDPRTGQVHCPHPGHEKY
jgi:type II secretory pathway pseudopilin PulG